VAVRLLPLEEIEAELKRLNCTWVKNYGTAAIWKTARGVHFTVPQEGPDKRCNEYSWRQILSEIAPYL
jgi:hypothetical protein